MKYRICEMLNDKFNVQVEFEEEWRNDIDISSSTRFEYETIFSCYQEAIEYLNSKKKAEEEYQTYKESLEKGKIVAKVLDEMEF